MALHAGFAAALSISAKALQAFIHAAYVNNLMQVRLKNSVAHGANTVAFDLVLVEPMLDLIDNPDNLVFADIELVGPLTFSGPGLPTLGCVISVKARISMPVVRLVDDKSKAIQFGLDTEHVVVVSSGSTLISGTDPNPVYGDIVGNSLLTSFAIMGAVTQDPNQFLFTPPLLEPFARRAYVISALGVLITQGSLNLGVDIAGFGQGDASKLVDMNLAATDKGFKKTLQQAAHTGDDDYGVPFYDTVWSGTTLRQKGPHKTGVAVSINSVILNDLFLHSGRYELFSRFEQSKFEGISGVIKQINSPYNTVYEPSAVSLTSLNAIDVVLGHDVIEVTGIASSFSAIAVHVDFALKLRIVHTYMEGNTQYLMNYASADGVTAESFDVDISQPAWLTALQGVTGVVGVLLAWPTSGASLVVVMLLETVVSAVVGSVLENAESGLSSGVFDAVSGFKGITGFTLPGTQGPTFALTLDDVVVRPDSMSAWFHFEEQFTQSYIHIQGKNGPAYAPVVNDTWSARRSEAIDVIMENGGELYNRFDPRVRIQWRVYANDTGNPIAESDVDIASAADPLHVSINHSSAALASYTGFIVRCRIYRPWGGWTQELFNQELRIAKEDRLDRTHPYVRWQHTVFYPGYSEKQNDPKRQALGWVVTDRLSKIHYTDPAKRCRFADAYSPDLGKDQLNYFNTLPFELADIAKHRKQVCPYCFFGGPDKLKLK